MAFGGVEIAQITGFAASGLLTAAGYTAAPVGPNVGIVMGGAAAGAIYAPQPGDLVLVAKDAAGRDLVLGGYIDPTSPPAWLPTMAAGEFVVGNKAGAYIKLTALGDIVLVPAAGRNVLLGAAGATVARVGDAVAASGTDPQGGTVSVTGTITAGSSEVKA
jgi:hypothetical protein